MDLLSESGDSCFRVDIVAIMFLRVLQETSCRPRVSLCVAVNILSGSSDFVFYSRLLVGIGCLRVLEWISCRHRVSLMYLCFAGDILSASSVFVF